MKKALKIFGAVLLVVVFVVATLVGYLTIDEYYPDDVEKLEIYGESEKKLSTGDELTFMTWNIGYGALGDNADFFMDGGKMVYSADEERVQENLAGIFSNISEVEPDILFLQEIDRNSSRSYYVDELDYLYKSLSADNEYLQNAFAPNFKVAFVPLPVPPIGKVEAGLGVISKYKIDSAERIKLPCPFSWPLRTFNLKRCLQVMRVPVEDSDKELVLINLHLEAYDSGEGKIAQTNMLKELMQQEVQKGNYVIVAGDFNQTFSNVDMSKYPVLEGKWEAGTINVEDFGENFEFLTDSEYPTCRSLDSVLADAQLKDPEHFQYYMLDGYIVSDNVEVTSVTTINTEFKYADHNPVVLKFSLQ